MELSRPLWNSQSALVSIRILPDLVSSSPFASPLPCLFLSSNRQNEIWARDQSVFISISADFGKENMFLACIWPLFTDIIHTYRCCFSDDRQGKFWTWEQTVKFEEILNLTRWLTYGERLQQARNQASQNPIK